MYKKYASEKKAWRFGLSTALSVINPTQNSRNGNTVYVYTSNVNVALSAGKEVQKFITNKWVWYYGGDLLLTYASSNIDRYQNTDVKIQSSSAGTSGVTARPFLGMRFNITKQLYVSTEFSINLGYAQTNRHDEDFTNNAVSDSKNSIYTLGFTPASSLFLFYRF